MLQFSMWIVTWIVAEAFTPPRKPRVFCVKLVCSVAKQNDQSVGLAADLGLDYWAISLRWLMMVDVMVSILMGWIKLLFLGPSNLLDPHLVLGHGWCRSSTGIIKDPRVSTIDPVRNRLSLTNSQRVLLNRTKHPFSIKDHESLSISSLLTSSRNFNQWLMIGIWGFSK